MCDLQYVSFNVGICYTRDNMWHVAVVRIQMISADFDK